MKLRIRSIAGMVAVATILAAAVPAGAGTVLFTGSRQNINPLNPPGTGVCAPANTVNIAPGALSSTGTTDKFGAFTSTQKHCIAGPPPNPLTDGIFTYDFGSGNTLFGTYTGDTTSSATPGIFDAKEYLTIGGGTGKFAGATGWINTTGTLSLSAPPKPVGTFSGTLSGSVTAGGLLPESSSWVMMIGGLGAAGGMHRRQRRKPVLAAA